MPNNPNSQNNTNEFNPLIRHWGTTAQRPTTNMVLYQEYLNVDIPAVQYYDGATWQTISGGGGWTAVDASTTVKGIGKTSVAPVSPTNPIFVGDNDSRMTNARTPVGTALTSGQIWVGSGFNVAAAVGMSGDGSISNTGVFTLTPITTGAIISNPSSFTFNNNGQITAAGSGNPRVDLQAGTGLPGTSQTGSARVSGSIAADTAFYRNSIAMNNVTVLDKVCRVLDDTTSRATGYANAAVQVSGTLDLASGWVTLPATLKACWYTFFILTAASTGVGVVVENPSFIVGSSTMRGTTVQQSAGGNFAYSGGGVVSLDASGRMRFVYAGTANATRIIIEIWAYSV